MTPMKGISSSARKAKGREFQQWVASKISQLTGFPWGKDQPIESRPMGQDGVDIRLDTVVRKVFPYSVECKRQEGWSVQEWIRQAKSNQIVETDWLLFIRSSRENAVVVMDAERFFDLLRGKADGTRENKVANFQRTGRPQAQDPDSASHRF